MSFIVVLMIATIFVGCSSTTKTATNVATTDVTNTDIKATEIIATAATSDDIDGDTLPNSVEKTYGTNPYSADTDGDTITDDKDDQPNYADMPFAKDGSALNVEIKNVRVEDNSTEDHLEIAFKNTGDKTLDGLDIYYTIEDKIAGVTEAYYQELTGVQLAAGEETIIHFDNLVEANHFPVNMNGLYGTSENGPTFSITLHNKQNEYIDVTVTKDIGAAEVAD